MPKRKLTDETPQPMAPKPVINYAQQMKAIKKAKAWLTPPEDRAEAQRIRLHNELAALENEFQTLMMTTPKGTQQREDLFAEIDRLKGEVPSFDPTNPRDAILNFDEDDFPDMEGEEA